MPLKKKEVYIYISIYIHIHAKLVTQTHSDRHNLDDIVLNGNLFPAYITQKTRYYLKK